MSEPLRKALAVTALGLAVLVVGVVLRLGGSEPGTVAGAISGAVLAGGIVTFVVGLVLTGVRLARPRP